MGLTLLTSYSGYGFDILVFLHHRLLLSLSHSVILG